MFHNRPDNCIILPVKNFNKDKINILSGTICQPFTKMVWVVSNGDLEILNQIASILVSMNTNTERVRLLQFIRLMYGLLGLQFPDGMMEVSSNDKALDYLLFSFALDFEEVIQEYVQDSKMQTSLI